jgi:long-chain acyl-CoA synthetase
MTLKSKNFPGFLPLGGLLEANARRYPNRIALIKKEVFTYGQTEDAVKRIAFQLKKRGVRKGDKIGILAENGPFWILSFFAIEYVGGVCVPLDVRSGALELKGIMEHSETSFLFAQRKFLKSIEDFVRERMIGLILLDGERSEHSIWSFLSQEPAYAVRESRSLEEPCIIFYTSGTTGAQKGVVLTHRNVVSNIDSLLRAVNVDENDRFFSLLPLSHAYELVAGNLVPIAACASIAYSSSLKPKEMLEEMVASKPTIILTVPLILEKLLKGIERRIREFSGVKRLIFQTCMRFPGLKGVVGRKIRESMGLERLRFFVSGGAHLPESVELGLRKFGIQVIQGYGLTEASPVVSLNPPERPRPGSCGIPLPDVQVMIIDKREDGIGEIVVKGQNVMKGYYKNEKATSEAILPDGSLLTGDVGYLDTDGYLYITGRKKSVIITRGGLTIYPEEIENALAQSPFIKDVLVIKKEKGHGEELHAIIVPEEESFRERTGHLSSPIGEASLVHEIIRGEIDRISKNLADYKRIRNFSIRSEDFPKTASGKIKRYLFAES